MAEQCVAITKSGKQCRAAAVTGSPLCAIHADPGRAAELGRLGGRKNRHYVETADIQIPAPESPADVEKMLAQAAVDLLAGKLDPKRAHALTYIGHTLLKAMAGAELDQRLSRLEEQLHGQSSHDSALPPGDSQATPVQSS